jgi:RNA-dependent RNA polymerase
VTPTKTIFSFPEPNLSNRVTRKFGAANFLRIRFRDEDQRKLNSLFTTTPSDNNFASMDEVYNRILTFLSEGLSIHDRKYEFLAMSSSQLREHGCWLYTSATSLTTPEAIREFMGDLSSIHNVGKYAARLGQSLSSSIETFQAEHSQFTIINDVLVGEYNFTDGIGKISGQKAAEISKTYFKDKYISSFQIRFAGFKVLF